MRPSDLSFITFGISMRLPARESEPSEWTRRRQVCSTRGAPERVERRRRSARIAIDIKPAFDRITFIEKNPKHCAALEALRAEHPGRRIEVRNGVAGQPWASRRAVILDPYGMSVSRETLVEIQKTKAVDVWYLVSLSDLFRQAARDGRALGKSKRAAITQMFGTDEWEAAWCTKTTKTDLFRGSRQIAPANR